VFDLGGGEGRPYQQGASKHEALSLCLQTMRKIMTPAQR
jgi:hypothetical protein